MTSWSVPVIKKAETVDCIQPIVVKEQNIENPTSPKPVEGRKSLGFKK